MVIELTFKNNSRGERKPDEVLTEIKDLDV